MMSFCVVPGPRFPRHVLFVGERDIERQQPRRSGGEGHRRVHRAERNAVDTRRRLADVRDRQPEPADFRLSASAVVAVVTGLRRQVERNRGPVCPLLRFQRGSPFDARAVECPACIRE